jgi:raffinose/stachyose/melibiose transport system permease protein
MAKVNLEEIKQIQIQSMKAKRKKVRDKWLTISFFVLPALIFYALIVPYPILQTIYYSFFKWNLLSDMKFIGLDNYVRLFTIDTIFMTALKNTLIFATLCIILQIPLALCLAYILSGKIKGARFFRNSFFMPVIISGTAVGLMWQFFYHGEMGLINILIRSLGFEDFSAHWISDPNFAIYAVIISVSWQYFGYHMIILLSGMSTISSDIMEAAKIDGANAWDVFIRITVPLIKPFLVISLVLALTGSVKSFDNVIALTGGGPSHASSVLALHMYNSSFWHNKYGYGSAIAVILLILNLFFTLVFSIFLKERNKGVKN